ncbi:MAG: TIGR03663 family protein [Phycisphaerae bacterium]
MLSRRLFATLFILTLIAATALRLPELARRPMHGDEAVHAAKLDTLLQTRRYVYDPHQYHGPTLYYFTLPVARLLCANSIAELDETALRIVPVLFSLLTLALLPLIADGLGRTATLAAGVLLAVSPAMVFYSRYYIQESLLVFFTFAAIVACWRWVRSESRRSRGAWVWALLAGVAIGLAHATKETCVIAFGCAAVAAAASHGFSRMKHAQPGAAVPQTARGAIVPRIASGAAAAAPSPRIRVIGMAALASACAVATSALFMSGFFTNPGGPRDSVLAYADYFRRSGGDEIHVHPWHFYLELLGFWHERSGPYWSEGAILIFGVIGLWRARIWRARIGQASDSPEATHSELKHAGRAASSAPDSRGDPRLVRCWAIYATLMLVTYSAIPYKTPWCALGFLHGFALLGGIGIAPILQHVRPLVRGIGIVVFCAAAAHLAWQAQRAGYRYAADPRNPYVYAHSVRGVVDLGAYVERLREIASFRDSGVVKVYAHDCWPLPWYLRRVPRVGHWESPPTDADADVVIVWPDAWDAAQRGLRGEYHESFSGIRPDVVAHVLVARRLYDEFAARLREKPP